MKRFLFGLAGVGMALLLASPLTAQTVEMLEIFPGAEIQVFTSDVLNCKSPELDIEVYRGSDATGTMKVLVYKREGLNIAFVEYREKQGGEWYTFDSFFYYHLEVIRSHSPPWIPRSIGRNGATNGIP